MMSMHVLFMFTLILFTMNAVAQKKEASPRHFWHTLESTAPPEKIWATWTDVARWHQWDSGLKQAEMTEAFALGAKGVITSLEGRKSKFKVVDYQPGQSYTFKTQLPLGSLYVKRSLEVKAGKTYFTHEVWFSGLTGGIFARQFGPKFMTMLPEVMNQVKNQAFY